MRRRSGKELDEAFKKLHKAVTAGGFTSAKPGSTLFQRWSECGEEEKGKRSTKSNREKQQSRTEMWFHHTGCGETRCPDSFVHVHLAATIKVA